MTHAYKGSAILSQTAPPAERRLGRPGDRRSRPSSGLPTSCGTARSRSTTSPVSSATHTPSLYRLLRALASSGIFAEREHRVFELTPLAEPLRSDVPGSLRAMCALRVEPWFLGAWGELLHSIRTGEPGFDRYAGSDLFTFLQRNPDALATFGEAMGSLVAHGFRGHSLRLRLLTRWSHCRRGGGGQGALLTAILQAHPTARGVLFDRPETVAQAAELLKRAAVEDRCGLVGGSFFERVPEDGDLYILKSVIHDWEDEQAVAILRNVRRAISAAGKLLLIERVIPPGNTPSTSKWMDLNMLVAANGRERTICRVPVSSGECGFRACARRPRCGRGQPHPGHARVGLRPGRCRSAPRFTDAAPQTPAPPSCRGTARDPSATSRASARTYSLAR